jgi:hypothetical protein
MKRRNVLFIALMLLNCRAFSQVLSFSTSDTISFSIPLAAEDTTQSNTSFFFITNKGHTDTAVWKAINFAEDSSWSLGFCDPNNCYDFTNAIPDLQLHSFVLDSLSVTSMDFTASPSCVADSGELQVLIWLEHDSTSSATVLTFLPSFTGSCTPTGIRQTSASNYTIYPTHLNSELNIGGLNSLGEMKITLYDLIGNAVIQNEYSAHSNLVKLNTAKLPAGIYFVSVESNGQRVLTKRVEKLN